jgi:hypothetical protein
MTYEDKMLEVFARFRGEALGPGTLAAMEAACQAEVWSHLPSPILNSWRFHLGVSDTQPPQLELRPEHIGLGTVAELESALRSPFQEHPTERKGGIAGVGLSMSGDERPAHVPPAQPAPRESRIEPGTIQFQVGAPPPAAPASAGGGAGPAAAAPAGSASAGGARTSSLGAEIEAQARELGITPPSAGSLLGSFLEALAVATEQKARADELEAKLLAIAQAFK